MKTHYVRSRTDKEKIYTVNIHDTFCECNCEAYKFRHSCAHIKHILEKHYGKN